MAADRSTVLVWLTSVAGSIVRDAEDEAQIARRVDAAAALDAGAFSAEVIDLVRIVAENADDEPAYAALAEVDLDAGASRDAIVLLSAVALALAVGRIGWPSRQAARKARSTLQARAEEAYAVASPLGPDLYAWLRSLVQVAVRLVSEIAANAAPMAQVSTPLSIPSTVAAYHLYGDANRARQVVDIARSATPMLMPSLFDVLAE